MKKICCFFTHNFQKIISKEGKKNADARNIASLVPVLIYEKKLPEISFAGLATLWASLLLDAGCFMQQMNQHRSSTLNWTQACSGDSGPLSLFFVFKLNGIRLPQFISHATSQMMNSWEMATQLTGMTGKWYIFLHKIKNTDYISTWPVFALIHIHIGTWPDNRI